MAATESLIAASPVSEADLARAEKYAREPFVHEGEDASIVLAGGSPRRRALDDALAEIDSGLDVPSIEWRREYALMLGLERLLSEEQPHLADGTELSAHQVDALSGTLAALMAEAQSNGRNGNGRSNGSVSAEDIPELPSGELELEGDLDYEDTLREEGDDEIGEDEEPLDWDAEAEGASEEDDEGPPPEEDPGADRRFWFEHATGAGKTVAALGFVEASRTGGVLVLTHRRNLVDQFNG